MSESILTICCECGKTIKKGQLKDGRVSDGICPSCASSLIAQMMGKQRAHLYDKLIEKHSKDFILANMEDIC